MLSAPRYLEERHVGLDPGENGGLVEEFPGWVGRSAHQAVRTLLLGVLNQAAHLHHIPYSMRNCIKFRKTMKKRTCKDHHRILRQCWGSVTFWCGSGSADPYL